MGICKTIKTATVGNVAITITANETNTLYFVYFNGKVVLAYTTPTECFAVLDALNEYLKIQPKCNVTEATENK